jgi:hypothetical protein
VNSYTRSHQEKKRRKKKKKKTEDPHLEKAFECQLRVQTKL